MKRVFLIDIGNSALKWAEASTPQNTGVVVYGDEVALAEQVRDFYISQRPDVIYGCTVANARIAEAVRRVCYGARVEWLGSQPRFAGAITLENSYEDYTKLGADRWYAALGAVGKHPGSSLLVVQMGTALTADSIRFEGEGRYRYLGGRIAPGPTMMFNMLRAGAARLKGIERGAFRRFPLNTNDAVTEGVMGCIEGFIRSGLRSFEGEAAPRLVITGGAAKFFEREIREHFPECVLDDNLVITGLSLRVESEATEARRHGQGL